MVQKSQLERITDTELKNPDRRKIIKGVISTSLLPRIGFLSCISSLVSGCVTLGHQIVYPTNVKCPIIGSDYGDYKHFDGSERIDAPHDGIDIPEERGYPVIAAADGKVIIAAYLEGRFGGSGDRVIIYHGKDVNGRHVYSGYHHMNELHVKTSQDVNRGQQLGTVGSTQFKTLRNLPPHLHFEVHVSHTDFYIIREDGSVYMHGAKRVNPHDFWLQDKNTDTEKRIIIPPFVKGREYPKHPIRFTYPVPCR